MQNFSIQIIRSDSPYLQEFSVERNGVDAKFFYSFAEINASLQKAALTIPEGHAYEMHYIIFHQKKSYQGIFYLHNFQEIQNANKKICLFEDLLQETQKVMQEKESNPEKSRIAEMWRRMLLNVDFKY